MTRSRLIAITPLALIFAFSATAYADSALTLRSNFLEKYKNRLTIDCDYVVDAAHKKANPAAKDGDLHVAGRCKQIGLPMVAEIQNAASESEAVDEIHAVEGTGKTISITGVWRIWPEHGGNNAFVQLTGPGKEWKGTPATNPPHVFEIHPVTNIEKLDLHDSLKPISGFETKPTDDAFQRYESSTFSLRRVAGNDVEMVMRMVGYNYVNFVMQLTKREITSSDGEFVFAGIRNNDDELLVRDLRVGFVKDSDPYKVERTMSEGQCLKLLGVPRVDLALVSWRIKNSASNPSVLQWGMPYEIIAVGVSGAPFSCESE